MNSIDFTFLDKEILTQLQKRGMSINESIQLINFEIYYLNYRDRAAVRKAVRLVGEDKKQAIISKIHMNKRKSYIAELLANENKYHMESCNYLFGV